MSLYESVETIDIQSQANYSKLLKQFSMNFSILVGQN